MAKKAAKTTGSKPKVTRTTSIGPGSVSVTFGIKLAKNFSSGNYELTATVPLTPGDDPVQALGSLDQVVGDYFSDQIEGVQTTLHERIAEIQRSLGGRG